MIFHIRPNMRYIPVLLLMISNGSSNEDSKCIKNVLNKVYVRCKNFDQFPHESLSMVYSEPIQSISFSNSTFSHIPVEAFKSINSVEMVHLDYLEIQTLDVGCFSGLEHVDKINLNNNKLTQISMGIFNTLSDLKNLYIKFNQIFLIEEQAFTGMTYLEQLSLKFNKIETVSNDIFKSLTSLNRLDLSHNHLKTFNFNLADVPLKHLKVDGNQIITIETLPKTLNYLDVSNNELTNIDFVTNLDNLKLLYAGDNNLTGIKLDSFENMSKLEQLFLNNNRLTYIPLGTMRDLTSLKFLDLSYNLIKELDFGTLTGLKSLTGLDISHNTIEYLNEQIFYDALETIDVSYTNVKIISITDLFYQCKNLKLVKIFGLNITCIELNKIVNEATLKNVEIEEGYETTTANVHGIPCINTKSSNPNISLVYENSGNGTINSDVHFDYINNLNFFKNKTEKYIKKAPFLSNSVDDAEIQVDYRMVILIGLIVIVGSGCVILLVWLVLLLKDYSRVPTSQY